MIDYVIPNYTLHSSNLEKDIGRGMAVYSHVSIDKSMIEIRSDIQFEEICPLEFKLRGCDTLLFGSLYSSPTKSTSSDANNKNLNELLKCLSHRENTHNCLVGDLNYRNINWQTRTTSLSDKSLEAKFIESVRDSFLHQQIEKPTRRRGNDDPSTLDLILTNEEMQVPNVIHHAPLGKSDHNLITFGFHCYLDYTKPKEKYDFARADYNAMIKHLQREA